MHVVNGLEEARATLVAIRHSPFASTLELVSPPFAACHAGVQYYIALIEQLRTEFPHDAFEFTVCCGNDPAIAHDALRLGIQSIICDVPAPMFAKLKAIADGLGAKLRQNY